MGVGYARPRQLYPREIDPVPIVQETGWAPRPVWRVRKSKMCVPGHDYSHASSRVLLYVILVYKFAHPQCCYY